jgi:hypothetical protein
MSNCTAESLRFPPVAGLTIRAEFDGGPMSTDIGPLLLREVDRPVGLTERLAQAIEDRRHPSYVKHPLRDLLAQRIYQIGCGYEDANDANSLRHDPLFQLGLERDPLSEAVAMALARASTFSRLENSVSSKDLYRLAKAFVEGFIASYATPPELIVLDLDHSEDRTHGEQELSSYNGHYGSHCYLPLFVFEGLSGHFITAVLRPGKRPTGAENASIVKRILTRLRQHWPETHIVLRGDSHFANPELMELKRADPLLDFVFGVAGNPVLSALAEPALARARALHQLAYTNAERTGNPLPVRTRLYEELDYAAGSWPQQFRVVVKAEIMSQGENPRFVVTSLERPTPQSVYRLLYCGRGQDENYIKHLKQELCSDRTSDHSFRANTLRLYFACGAYVLHHALRTETLRDTELAQAQPATVIGKLFKLAVRVIRYKDRIKLQLPSACPVQGLLKRVTEILYRLPKPAWNTG